MDTSLRCPKHPLPIHLHRRNQCQPSLSPFVFLPPPHLTSPHLTIPTENIATTPPTPTQQQHCRPQRQHAQPSHPISSASKTDRTAKQSRSPALTMRAPLPSSASRGISHPARSLQMIGVRTRRNIESRPLAQGRDGRTLRTDVSCSERSVKRHGSRPDARWAAHVVGRGEVEDFQRDSGGGRTVRGGAFAR